MKTTILILTLLLTSSNLTRADAPSSTTAAEALKLLQAGNQRFVSGHPAPKDIVQRRAELVKGQKPSAIIVACADSRVGPEIVFDQELGNLFVVRTAGEVLDAAGIGSIEYAVAHLGSPLLVVLGHEKCGAVAAAVTDAKESGHIADIVKAIRPAVVQTKGWPGDALENAIRANALDIAAQLHARSAIVAESVKAGKLTVLPATLSLATGRVDWLQVEGIEWQLTELNSQPVTVPATLKLDAATKRASGNGGCNSFSGGYTMKGVELHFGAIAATRKFCEGATGETEMKLFQALEKTRTWRLHEGRLQLWDGASVLAQFTPASVK